MPAKYAFRFRSRCKESAMSVIACEAREIVWTAAEPLKPTETIKARMNRAAANLRYSLGDWRIKAAWYGEAGCWGADTFRDLQERYLAWRERQEAKTNAHSTSAAYALRSLRASYAATYADFYREQIVALDHALMLMGGKAPNNGDGDSAVDAAKGRRG